MKLGEGSQGAGDPGLDGGSAADNEGGSVTGTQWRVGVFVDYWWVYSSARHVFAHDPAVPPPTWFGNVSPSALARVLVKRPPATVRRSQRSLAGVHVFVRHYDPEVHRGQHERVQRWLADGAVVDVGPARVEGGGFWQGSLNVALAAAVVESLARGVYDTAVVFAGDAGLSPLLARAAGDDPPAPRIELATWVAPDGSVPTPLAAVPGVWCHRLGSATFNQLVDDRRSAHRPAGQSGNARRPNPPRRPAGPPRTAMAAALVAAGVTRSPGAAPPAPAKHPIAAAAPPPAAQPTTPPAAPTPAPAPTEASHAGDNGHGVVRRLAQRLRGKNP